MYNKLFTKILDSSIWLAPDPHRLVWITLIAAMDEDGNAMFACVENLAARARVTVKQAESAVAAFETPDLKSGDPDYDGRRIERFPGGWHVLNAHKYREMVTRAIIRDQTRARVAKYRERHDAPKTDCNAPVTQCNENVTPSEAISIAISESEKEETPEGLNVSAWNDYTAHRKELRAKRLTPRGEQMAMKKLATLSHDDQRTVVDRSIENGWIGLFPEKLNEKTERNDSFTARLKRTRQRAGLD